MDKQPTHPALTAIDILAALPASYRDRAVIGRAGSIIVTADRLSIVITPTGDLVTIGIYRWQHGDLVELHYRSAITPDTAADLVRMWVTNA